MVMQGRQADKGFSAGVIAGLRTAGCTFGIGSDDHWRPSVLLPQPFGRVEGDFGVQVIRRTTPKPMLLLIEREASAPGNERNILKWLPAWRKHMPVELRRGADTVTVPFDDAVLALVFGRPTAKWSKSDFDKTVAFCGLLADSVQRWEGLNVVVHVLPEPLQDWERAGFQAGSALSKRLGV